MRIQLSDHFSYRKLIKFTFPSIAMMIFTSIYGVVDGFFVSNFAGKTPFAADVYKRQFLHRSLKNCKRTAISSESVRKDFGRQKAPLRRIDFQLQTAGLYI